MASITSQTADLSPKTETNAITETIGRSLLESSNTLKLTIMNPDGESRVVNIRTEYIGAFTSFFKNKTRAICRV